MFLRQRSQFGVSGLGSISCLGFRFLAGGLGFRVLGTVGFGEQSPAPK